METASQQLDTLEIPPPQLDALKTSSPQLEIADAPPLTDAPESGPIASPATFAEMRLKVGDKIPISLPRGAKGERVLGKVIGWIEGGSILITLPQKVIMAGLVKEGENLLLRAFTGKSAFAFNTNILKIEHFPYTYLHLGFPKKIEAVVVRSSFRHGVCLPVTIAIDGKADMTGNILNIGMTGVRIGTAEPLQDEDPIRLTMQFELHDVPVSLELHAQVRSSKSVPDENGALRHEYGMEFQNLQPNDRLILGSLLWYEMHMHPERAA
jgi:hypothetical protein